MKLNGAGIINMYCLFKGQNTDKEHESELHINKEHTIIIPYYQRPYRWTESYIQDLFDDYNANFQKEKKHSEYFVGATVAVERKEDTQESFELIDGQQRTTTMYLINYIRYMIELKRIESILKEATNIGNAPEYIDYLSDIYVNMIGKDQENVFSKLKSDISTTISKTFTQEMTLDEAKHKIIKIYKEKLGLVSTLNTSVELSEEEQKKNYYKESKKKLEAFFKNESLCLAYSRGCYNDYLKEALCSIVIMKENTSEVSIKVIDEKNKYIENYLNAIKIIFELAKKYCSSKKNTTELDSWDFEKKMADYLKEMIDHLRFCLILTDDPDDAYTLFETLNSRALEVDDLELLKNHFYREYCTKSQDNNDTKNKVIDELDHIWVKKIFSTTQKRNRLIAYLGTIYITQSLKNDKKNNIECKNEIKYAYTSQLKEYSSEQIKRDINIFYAMSILINAFDATFQNTGKAAINVANNNSVSITYKTFLLILAMGREAVLAALTNIILAKYLSDHKQNLDIDDFKQYVEKLKNDKMNKNEKFVEIHNIAFMFWQHNILAKDYELPRKALAIPCIEHNGLHTNYHNVTNFLTKDNEEEFQNNFKNWINEWSYLGDDKSKMRVKILFLYLFGYTRICKNGKEDPAYENDEFILKKSANTYGLDEEKINLDHLEAAKIVDIAPEDYFLADDEDKRTEIVNSLGNMMILDFKENNKKNNFPLRNAFEKFYSGQKDHWMYKDIADMMHDEKYFDIVKKIPKQEFFERRKKILVACFKALLNSKLDEDEIDVSLKR